MGWTRRTTRRRGLLVAAAATLVATACGPDPTPAPPTWVTTGIERVTTPTSVTNFAGAWTDENWAATVEIYSPQGGPAVGTLLVSPRSGPGNSVLGTPQRVAMTIAPGFPRLVGDHIVGVAGAIVGNPTSTPGMEFFRPTAGTWASAGVVSIPVGQQAVALTDEWMITRTDVVNPGTDSVLRAYPVDASGPTVTVGTPVVLPADPAWPTNLREGFGAPGVAIDGDVLVAGAQGQFNPAPGGARVFRFDGTTWNPVLSLGAAPDGPMGFARTVAADDGPSVDRIAIGPVNDSAPVVEVYADTGAGFVLEQTVVRDPSGTDTSSGLYFATGVGLDGDLLAVTSRMVEVASSTPGHTPVRVGYVQMYRRGAVWSPEAEVPVFHTPGPAATTTALAFGLKVVGNHVAATVLVSPDPPPGCSFPCFNIGFEAWSLDRTG